ncbi:hypothetical protein [uncultured Ruegeria sp.]|uniref:hypothetical protein n=1 Tax=uncultured Ruegeria sp. TaxID=259304 RepID=UPI00260F1759|nr:hypothetical protein [uncultured Ruegeria sp.]
MAYENDCVSATQVSDPIRGWATRVRSWVHARRIKNARKKEIERLLAGDERMLKDAGVTRSELVRALGHNPRELPNIADFAGYRVPYIAMKSSTKKIHS